MAIEALRGKLRDWNVILRLRYFMVFTVSACLSYLHVLSCFALSLH
jgi:hypothetical protein